MNIKHFYCILIAFLTSYQIVLCQEKKLYDIFLDLENIKQNDIMPPNLYTFLYRYRINPYGFTALQNLKVKNINDSITIGKIYFDDYIGDNADSEDTTKKQTFYAFIYNNKDELFYIMYPHHYTRFRDKIKKINPENSLIGFNIYNKEGVVSYAFIAEELSSNNYDIIYNFKKDGIYHRKIYSQFERKPRETKTLSEHTIDSFFYLVKTVTKQVDNAQKTYILNESEIQNIKLPER